MEKEGPDSPEELEEGALTQVKSGQADRKICSHPGCIFTSRNNGLCPKHKPSDKCTYGRCFNDALEEGGLCAEHSRVCAHDGCTKLSQMGGYCRKHNEKLRCKHEGCNNQKALDGYCARHNPNLICKHEGCDRQTSYKGLCIKHKPSNKCTYYQCLKNALKEGGLCEEHNRVCAHDGCKSLSHVDGYCRKHSEKLRCKHEGCNNQKVLDGYCARHNNKIRCKHEGCNTKPHYYGLCHRHGGKAQPKYCSHEGCTKRAIRFGVCWSHGAKHCKYEGCEAQVERKGLCSKHIPRETMACSRIGCNRIATDKCGVCFVHGGVLVRKKRSHEDCNRKIVSGEMCVRIANENQTSSEGTFAKSARIEAETLLNQKPASNPTPKPTMSSVGGKFKFKPLRRA